MSTDRGGRGGYVAGPLFGSGLGKTELGTTEPTYTVSELAEDLRDALQHAFQGLWVVGEVHRPRPSRAGHLYFELIEKGRGDEVVGKIDAVLWRTDHQRAKRQLARQDLSIVEGSQLRCYGSVDFYPPNGRLQLVVREVDPVWGLGQLERRRRETLTALEAAGLLDANRGLPLAEVPLRLGLVTSIDSAAYHDFLTGLDASGFGFRVRVAHATVQGAAAEREVPAALARLSATDLDAIVLVRGGGSRSDLAAFDGRAIAEAVARCPLPVLCGLGHEIDRSIADEVCHTAVKTPSAVAELLVDRVATAERRVLEARAVLLRAAARQIERADARLRSAERLSPAAAARLREQARRVDRLQESVRSAAARRVAADRRALETLAGRVAPLAERTLDRRRALPERLAERLVDVARGRLATRRATVDGLARVCHQLAPERTLERGFALVHDADGRLVRSVDQVRSGKRLTTRVADGRIHSTVDETSAASSVMLSPEGR